MRTTPYREHIGPILIRNINILRLQCSGFDDLVNIIISQDGCEPTDKGQKIEVQIKLLCDNRCDVLTSPQAAMPVKHNRRLYRATVESDSV